MSSRISRFLVPLAALATVLCLASCGGEGEKAGEHAAAPSAELASAPLTSDEMKMKLASADALDGTTDQVVERCSGCRLGMNGKADHAIHVGDYTLHMCSESCKAAFGKDLEANITALEIPTS